MRNLRHVLQQVSRIGVAGTNIHVQVPARHLSGPSLNSTRGKRVTVGVNVNANARRRPTGAMELRRAAEVQKCADKVRSREVVHGEAESAMMTMTVTANTPRRFRAVSGLVPPTRSKYTSCSGWKSALICLGNMRKGGVAPGSAAYNVALKACVAGGEFDRAAALVEDMEGSGATPDADIVREIRAAGGGGGGAGLVEDDDNLTCDAVASDATTAAASSGGSRRSMSNWSGRGVGVGGRGDRGSFAGLHTVAVGVDVEWPSRRPAHERNGSSSESRSREDNDEPFVHVSFDPSSLNPIASDTGSSSSSSSFGSSSGSVAGMQTVTAGADGVWPSRRSTSDGNTSSSSGGGGGDRCRSLDHVAWGGGRERWPENQQHVGGTVGSHAGVLVGGKVGEGEAAWLSVKAAPFASSWGDD